MPPPVNQSADATVNNQAAAEGKPESPQAAEAVLSQEGGEEANIGSVVKQDQPKQEEAKQQWSNNMCTN